MKNIIVIIRTGNLEKIAKNKHYIVKKHLERFFMAEGTKRRLELTAMGKSIDIRWINTQTPLGLHEPDHALERPPRGGTGHPFYRD